MSRESQELLLMVTESPSPTETFLYLRRQVCTPARVVMGSRKGACPKSLPTAQTRLRSTTSWEAPGAGTHGSSFVSRAPATGRVPSTRTLQHMQHIEEKPLGKALLSLPQAEEGKRPMKEKGSTAKQAMEAVQRAGTSPAALLQHGACSKN